MKMIVVIIVNPYVDEVLLFVSQARKLQQRYQLDMESKLADVRAGYEARLAMEKAREVAAREQAEQKLRDMEAAALEARTLAVEARAVAVQTQCMREKTEALRRAESDHAQAMAVRRKMKSAFLLLIKAFHGLVSKINFRHCVSVQLVTISLRQRRCELS
jgi:hypothetical protein